VEVIQNIKTDKVKGEFVTMMEAHRRAMTGTKFAQDRGVEQEQMIKKFSSLNASLLFLWFSICSRTIFLTCSSTILIAFLMAYGNTHHVEIIQNIETNKIEGKFVTMMEASHRVKGINRDKQPIVKINHGDKWE
jgi:hypothetical protein